MIFTLLNPMSSVAMDSSHLLSRHAEQLGCGRPHSLLSCSMHEQELQDALDAVGVAQISCNPITDNNAAKALQRVAAEEAMPLSKEQALSIARSAAGDLRSAIEAVQLLCTGVAPLPPQPKTRKVAAPALFSPGVNPPNPQGPA